MCNRCFAKTLAIFLLLAGLHAFGQQERVLYRFNGTVGVNPIAQLISDPAGNFYGTANSGGTYDGGTAFMISPKPGGGWTGRVIYEFGNGTDGIGPYESLLLDASGNLYGVTKYGGTGREGTVFKLAPSAHLWEETILKNFVNDSADGWDPEGNLIFDKAGNLYGTTLFGGQLSGCAGAGCGTVYELSPGPGGTWTESILYAAPDAYHGPYPIGGLTFDSSGNLYGSDLHEVFELVPTVNGTWTKTAIHTFLGLDGDYPNGNLVFDKAGNLYGTTFIGGSGTGVDCDGEGCGVVFELTPHDGIWVETVLHDFNEDSTDGALPQTGLILDGKGNLYGTAPHGGAHNDCEFTECGVVFAMVQKPGGHWTEKILYNFTDSNGDGASPSSLALGPNGTLVGTTILGGLDEQGTLFAIGP